MKTATEERFDQTAAIDVTMPNLAVRIFSSDENSLADPR
jgi:hypothetical protein